MPRVTISVQVMPAPRVESSVSFSVSRVALDAVNGNQFVATGKELVAIFNAGAVTRNITFRGSPGKLTGRSTDWAIALGAGSRAITPVFPIDGWAQNDGMIYVDGDHADLQIMPYRVTEGA